MRDYNSIVDMGLDLIFDELEIARIQRGDPPSVVRDALRDWDLDHQWSDWWWWSTDDEKWS